MIKSYLESKGLDSTTSGQIAWFVYSVVISYIIFTLIPLESTLESKDASFLDYIFPTYLYNNYFKLIFFYLYFV
ncbi:hypothetical protein CQA49_09575 [Helicobacter sp. MIT 00-7814]|nr:hypothetical protein CQA49_09575 [Helicobacter sp. MIT 00-7814]RDU52001.1 hypothetical protein CQA37_09070 [Helicobacter sp. MIT 99-10781]